MHLHVLLRLDLWLLDGKAAKWGVITLDIKTYNSWIIVVRLHTTSTGPKVVGDDITATTKERHRRRSFDFIGRYSGDPGSFGLCHSYRDQCSVESDKHGHQT